MLTHSRTGGPRSRLRLSTSLSRRAAPSGCDRNDDSSSLSAHAPTLSQEGGAADAAVGTGRGKVWVWEWRGIGICADMSMCTHSLLYSANERFRSNGAKGAVARVAAGASPSGAAS